MLARFVGFAVACGNPREGVQPAQLPQIPFAGLQTLDVLRMLVAARVPLPGIGDIARLDVDTADRIGRPRRAAQIVGRSAAGYESA